MDIGIFNLKIFCSFFLRMKPPHTKCPRSYFHAVWSTHTDGIWFFLNPLFAKDFPVHLITHTYNIIGCLLGILYWCVYWITQNIVFNCLPVKFSTVVIQYRELQVWPTCTCQQCYFCIQYRRALKCKVQTQTAWPLAFEHCPIPLIWVKHFKNATDFFTFNKKNQSYNFFGQSGKYLSPWQFFCQSDKFWSLWQFISPSGMPEDEIFLTLQSPFRIRGKHFSQHGNSC